MSSDSTTTHPEQTEPRQRIWPISTPDEQEELDSEGSRPGSLLELEVLNDQISKFLRADAKKLVYTNPTKQRAHKEYMKKAAEAVRTTTRRITRIITKQDLLKIEGVGESTAEKILHYIQSLPAE